MSLALLQMELSQLGLSREAEEADRQTLEVVQKLVADFPDVPYYLELLAWTWGMLGSGRQCLGQLPREEEAWRQALVPYGKLTQAFPTVGRYRNDMLWTQQFLGELLWSTGRRAEASELFRQIQDWTDRVSPEDAAGHDTRAWFLASCPDPQLRDARRAVEVARRATTLAPREHSYWTTLGIAHYRAGNWQDAIEASGKAQEVFEGSGWSYFCLAMAHGQLGHKDQARGWYDKGVQWMKKDRFDSRQLSGLRAEAEQVLGIKEPAK
jgi:tetratricopeptide (TPR) repeat protein